MPSGIYKRTEENRGGWRKIIGKPITKKHFDTMGELKEEYKDLFVSSGDFYNYGGFKLSQTPSGMWNWICDKFIPKGGE